MSELARKSVLDMIDFELNLNKWGQYPLSSLNKTMFVCALDPLLMLRNEGLDGDLLDIAKEGPM